MGVVVLSVGKHGELERLEASEFELAPTTKL